MTGLKIAIFSESYEPIINGVSRSVATLRDGLVKRGHEVFIFAPEFKNHNDDYKNVIRMPSMNVVKDYPLPLLSQSHARENFAYLKPDIVHTQIPFILGHLAKSWSREFRIPLVSTNHTLYADYAHYCPIIPTKTTQKVLISLMRNYYNSCKRVCVPSMPILELLRSYGVNTNIDIIKTGIEPVRDYTINERNELRKKLGYENKTVFLYVGRIAKEKNLDLLFEAFARICNEKTIITIVGGGPSLEEAKQKAKTLDIADKVTFTGMLKHDDIIPYFMASDIFVFPSVTDTQGIAICEAMSAQLACISMNAGGIPENMTHERNGFLSENNVEKFARYMELLANDKELREKMGVLSKLDSLKFSIEHMIDSFESFYTAALS